MDSLPRAPTQQEERKQGQKSHNTCE